MLISPNENAVFYDIDNTLVLWTKYRTKKSIQIRDPYGNALCRLLPHEGHIRLLKRHSAQGILVFVWSRGGVRWAEKIVKILKLTKYIYAIIPKVKDYVDDVPIEEWGHIRTYLKNGYGKNPK